MIIEKVQKYMQSQVKAWPCNTNRASELGHECDRYLYFLRTRACEKALHSVDAEYVFREGREQEKNVLRLLMDADIEVFEQQRPFEWKDHQITGHIDGKIMVDGEILPLEIKSMAPWIWEKTNTLKDMVESPYSWVRKYPAQLTMYLLMDEKERALFLLKNKSTGKLKEILISLDYEFAESLVQKAERVNEAVRTKTTPPPIEWGDTCEKCGFNHICLQEVVRKEIEFKIDPMAEERIDGWFELKQWADKWKDLDAWKKKYFNGVTKLIIGNYLITGKPIKTGWKSIITKL